MKVSERIIRYKENKSLFKFQHVEYGILEAIDDGDLKIGDKLPSINELKKELRYSAVTISKGYYRLIETGLIESIPIRGYFVICSKTERD